MGSHSTSLLIKRANEQKDEDCPCSLFLPQQHLLKLLKLLLSMLSLAPRLFNLLLKRGVGMVGGTVVTGEAVEKARGLLALSKDPIATATTASVRAGTFTVGATGTEVAMVRNTVTGAWKENTATAI